jgi:hypothetical protein
MAFPLSAKQSAAVGAIALVTMIAAGMIRNAWARMRAGSGG